MRIELFHALVAKRNAAAFTRGRRLLLITGIVFTYIVVGVVIVVVTIITTIRSAEFARRGDVLLLTLMTGLIKPGIQRLPSCCRCCSRAAARKMLRRASGRSRRWHRCVVQRRRSILRSLYARVGTSLLRLAAVVVVVVVVR